LLVSNKQEINCEEVKDDQIIGIVVGVLHCLTSSWRPQFDFFVELD